MVEISVVNGSLEKGVEEAPTVSTYRKDVKLLKNYLIKSVIA